ncbi:hypothetical protein CJ030_MR4G022366 [Morella rubra]|uniref:Uncharacterized protein n=1 Tax=Morella rubra TaxID=262757 RepID=A0A6A1VY12_9ROSI|nr:hypothetical protein CJ030_MR4G022366 [Morella rubra]
MIAIPMLRSLCKTPTFMVPSTSLGSSPFLQNPLKYPFGKGRDSKCYRGRRLDKRRGGTVVCNALLPVDPWAPNINSESIASQLFAFSLFPYIGFLYFITKSKSAPKLTLFGFYFLLVFVGATTKVHYGTSLSNVDWLHGGAESLLTLTNLFIVLGLREALRRAQDSKRNTSTTVSGLEEDRSSI